MGNGNGMLRLYKSAMDWFLERAAGQDHFTARSEGLGREFGVELNKIAKSKIGAVALKFAFAEGWRANKPIRDKMESRIKQLDRELKRTKNELKKLQGRIDTDFSDTGLRALEWRVYDNGNKCCTYFPITDLFARCDRQPDGSWHWWVDAKCGTRLARGRVSSMEAAQCAVRIVQNGRFGKFGTGRFDVSSYAEDLVSKNQAV